MDFYKKLLQKTQQTDSNWQFCEFLQKEIQRDKQMHMETIMLMWKLQHLWKATTNVKLGLQNGETTQGTCPEVYSTTTK